MADEIVFSAKYKEWISIKKMMIDENTKQPEVVAMLGGVKATITRKSFELAGVNAQKIDEYAEKLAKGKRKNYSSLAEIASGIKSSELKEVLAQSVVSPEQTPFAEAYFLRRLLETLGFDVDISIETLKKAYPELKIAKPKGNFGKKKKQ
ncbi:MAG: DUF2666 family protein [Candidatus Micrarchaeota archaeon]